MMNATEIKEHLIAAPRRDRSTVRAAHCSSRAHDWAQTRSS